MAGRGMTGQSPTPVDLHEFADAEALAAALAAAVAGDLRRGIEARGRASLAVSGGSTPGRFLQALARQPLDWSRVGVTLVDERWVPETSPRSNAALVRRLLLQGPAAAARFTPLHRPVPAPEDTLADLEQALRELPLPLDAAVLGMGEDGHTASFFPGGDLLEQALDPAGGALVLPMRASGAGEPRITLTLPVLLTAARLYLHVEGGSKRRVLEQALAAGSAADALPIARVASGRGGPMDIYWTA